MGQIKFTMALVFIALFSVAVISFAINFAADNNAPIDISNDPQLSSLNTETEGSLDTFSDQSESTYQSIIESSIDQDRDTTPTSGPFVITPFNVVGVVINILEVGYLKVFGSGAGFGIFLTAFVGMLTFIIGLYVWKTWAGRNPD